MGSARTDVWCDVCCTRHAGSAGCPGELPPSEPERHGWRINVATPHGAEAYGVLVARSDELWRARILTYPNVLWLVPGGRATLKFAGTTPQSVEQQAIDFIKRHCSERGYEMLTGFARVEPAPIDGEPGILPGPGAAAPRKIRFLPMRFGVVNPSEPAGSGNLSETGLFIITSFPLEPGTDLKMLIGLEEESVPLSGDVRWMCKQARAGRSPGMGVRLDSPPAPYLDYVRALS